jgi:hypothetical protein
LPAVVPREATAWLWDLDEMVALRELLAGMVVEPGRLRVRTPGNDLNT